MDADDRTLGELNDWLEIDGAVKSGGMGTIYRGRMRASGEQVAIKIMAAPGDTAGARFEREAQLLSQLKHPGIVRYIAHGTLATGVAYLVMEWLDGQDLDQQLTDSGLTPPASLQLVRRIADALGYAHERGVIHRDLKPSNLFLVDGDVGRVKLLDFGVARLLGGTSVTRTGAIIGTAAYMAPEQARGTSEVGPRTDIFALGCVLFKCLSGRSPFVASHPLAMMGQIIFQEAPRLRDVRPELPLSLDQLVADMLCKDPAGRPGDVRELTRRIDAIDALSGPAAISSATRPALGLTDTERRLMCVILVADALYAAGKATNVVDRGDQTISDSPQPTRLDNALTQEDDDATLAALCTEVQRHAGQAAPLANGSFVGVFMADGSATDLAARTAECALALRSVVPGAPMAIATGREVFGGSLPVGDLIERQVDLLRRDQRYAAPGPGGGPAPVRLDPTTAGLLDPRFQVSNDGDSHLLWRQLEVTTKPRTVLGRETQCVGRERERSLLEEIFEECVDEPVTRSVLLTGPAGIGKSRLRYEFLRWLESQEQAVEIWTAQTHAVGHPTDFELIGAALKQAAGLLPADPPAVQRRKIRSRVGRHFKRADRQRIADIIGALAGVHFPGSELLPAATGELGSDGRLVESFTELMQAECNAQPVLLVLEDVHWADHASMKLLDGLLRSLRDAPLMVLATARPEVHQRFPGLWFDRGVEEVRLHALRRSTCNRFVRSMIGDDTPKELVRQLVQQSGGNAFFLEELVRAHVEGAGHMPDTLLAMVQARLERFPSRARRVLRAASIFGGEFEKAGLNALLEDQTSAGQDVDQWLSFLEDQEVITRHPGRDSYLFVHAYMRDAAYAMLTDGDRVRAEKLAATWRQSARGGEE